MFNLNRDEHFYNCSTFPTNACFIIPLPFDENRRTFSTLNFNIRWTTSESDTFRKFRIHISSAAMKSYILYWQKVFVWFKELKFRVCVEKYKKIDHHCLNAFQVIFTNRMLLFSKKTNSKAMSFAHVSSALQRISFWKLSQAWGKEKEIIYCKKFK